MDNNVCSMTSAGLEPVLGHTEKSCKASKYRKFSTNIKPKIVRLIRLLRASKTGFNLIIFYINFREKMSIIRCDI